MDSWSHSSRVRLASLLWAGGLAACGPSTEGFEGFWEAMQHQQRVFHGAMGTTSTDESDDYRGWAVAGCAGALVVTAFEGCSLPAAASAKGFDFEQGSWCLVTSGGRTARWTVKGGSLSLVDRMLSGVLMMETVDVPVAGRYYDYTLTLDATSRQEQASPSCAGVHRDPVPPDDFSALAECTSFEDRSASGAERKVMLTGTGFSPRCLSISAGQSVTLEWDLGTAPLHPGTATDIGAGSPANPIGTRLVGTTATFAFPRPGDYPFNTQAGVPAVGLIRVK